MNSFIFMAPVKGTEIPYVRKCRMKGWLLGATLKRNTTLEFLQVTQVMSFEEWQEDVLDLCGCPRPRDATAYDLFYIKVYHGRMH